MSDKQIVERNGVSMDRHSTTVGGHSPWKNAEARASEVEAANKAVLNRYSDAKVQPWSEELGHEPDDLFCVFATANGAWRPIGYRKKTEGGAWISAASKLPAPLTEDAPMDRCHSCGSGPLGNCEYGGAERPRNLCPITASLVGEREGEFEYVRKPQAPIRAVKWTGDNLEEVRKVYPGLGEEYMRDKGCGVGHYVISPHKGRVYFQDANSFEETFESAALASKPSTDDDNDRKLLEALKERDDNEDRLTELAEAVGNYFDVSVGEWSSANDPVDVAMEILAGGYKTKFDKPYPEGIPERPKPDMLRSHKSDLMWPCYHKSSMDKYIEALLSAKDAEIAEWRSVSKLSFGEFYQRVSEALTLLQPIDPGVGPNTFVALVERLVSELSALKLSSASVRAEALRDALEVVRHHTDPTDASWGRLNALHRAILSLIPTSPESKEGKQ